MKRRTVAPILRASTARSSSILAAGALASRIAGWARITVLIAVFGATGTLDPFLAAFRIPDIVFALIAAGSIATVLVPQLSALLERGENLRAQRLVGSVLAAMMLLLILFGVVIVIVAKTLSGVLVGGLPIGQQNEVADLSIILYVATIALALSAVCSSAAAARSRFGTSAITGLLYSAGTIGGALIGGRAAAGYGPAIGTAVGAVAVLLVTGVVLMRSTLRPARPDFSDPLLRDALRSLLPRVGSVLFVQLLLAYLISLAGSSGPGAITIWSYAFTLMQVPLALVTSSIGMAILPKVAAHAARGNFARVRTIATLSIGTVIWMMSPIAALGALFAFDAVRLVVGGSIEVLSVAATADLLRLLLLGLVAHGIISVAIRLFYGLGDTLRPTIAEVCGCLVIFGFATLWFPAFGLSSIAMALPFGTWIQAIALVWLLARRSQIVHAATILKMIIFAVVASLVSAGLAVLVTSPFMDSAREVGVLAGTAAAGVGTIVGLAAYVGLTVLARRQEALPVLRLVASALPPKARALLLRGEVSS